MDLQRRYALSQLAVTFEKGGEEGVMTWKTRYVRDRETELESLSKAVRLVSRLLDEVRLEEDDGYREAVTRLREMCVEIRNDIDELGWVEADEWVFLSCRIENGLRSLRAKIDRSNDWFSLHRTRHREARPSDGARLEHQSAGRP